VLQNVFQSVKRRAWVVLAVAGAIGGAAAIADAAIPDSSGIIRACYQNNNGSLRVVDTPTTCKNNETALQWGQTGPQGPQGVIGPVGPQGSQGIQGPVGESPTDLYASYNDIDVTGDGPTSSNEIVGLSNLAPGTYLVNATIQVQELHCTFCGDPVVHCNFGGVVGGLINDYTVVFGEHAYDAQVVFPLTAILTFGSATNSVKKYCYSPDDDGHAYANITAVRVNPAGVKP